MRLLMLAALTMLGALGIGPVQAAESKISIVAAESMYGDIARQIGGDRIKVTSILNNPNQDPHLFETTPSIARALAHAQIVIVNGADYDPWMPPLLAAQPAEDRTVIVIAELIGRKPGDNPHLWYDPATPRALATALAEALSAADPEGSAGYTTRRDAFLKSWAPVEESIATVRARAAGAPVTASEPVFGYMADALGLTMRNQDFQRSVMNDTEPSARDTAAIEDDLRDSKVRAFIYNEQVADPLTDRLLGIAREAGVPVVGVTETFPAGTTYQDWILRQIDALDRALGDRPS